MDYFIVSAIVLAIVMALMAGTLLVQTGVLRIPDESRRFGCLDGLRGYLAVMVACHHFITWVNMMNGAPWSAPPQNLFNSLGSTGVSLFFMASGALFYKKICDDNLRVDWRGLYISRVFRIVPLMWVAVALILVILWSRGGQFSATDVPALARWLLFISTPDLMGYPETRLTVARVVWSLRFEWLFYALLPVLTAALWLSRGYVPRLVLLVAGTALIMATLRIGIAAYGLFAWFGLGMIAVELAGNARLRPWLLGPVPAVVGLILLVVQMLAFHESYAVVPGLMLFVFFVPVLAGNSYFGLLTMRGSVALGEISYGIYLLHGIVLSVLFLDIGLAARLSGSSIWLALPVVVPVVVLISTLLFRLVEQPMIRVGRRLRSRERTGARTPA